MAPIEPPTLHPDVLLSGSLLCKVGNATRNPFGVGRGFKAALGQVLVVVQGRRPCQQHLPGGAQPNVAAAPTAPSPTARRRGARPGAPAQDGTGTSARGEETVEETGLGKKK